MRSHPSRYWLWGVLALLPALWIGQALTSANPRILHILVHPSGEWAARLLIVTLMVTPLAMLFKQSEITRWLRRNRRYLGVGCFVYAGFHLAFYLADRADLHRVLTDLPKLHIWTGWLALVIFIPLAVTSADWAVRALGPRWKSMQRWTYVAAALTLVHWASLKNWQHPAEALLYFAPLIALESWRLWRWWSRHQVRAA